MELCITGFLFHRSDINVEYVGEICYDSYSDSRLGLITTFPPIYTIYCCQG